MPFQEIRHIKWTCGIAVAEHGIDDVDGVLRVLSHIPSQHLAIAPTMAMASRKHLAPDQSQLWTTIAAHRFSTQMPCNHSAILKTMRSASTACNPTPI